MLSALRAALACAAACCTLGSAAHADTPTQWITGGVGYGENIKLFRAGFEWRPECACSWLTDIGLEPRWVTDIGYYDARDRTTPNVDLWQASLLGAVRWPIARETRWQPFLQLGLGGSAVSKTRIATRKLGTAFQFVERLSAGFALDAQGRYELAAFVGHSSNAGIKEPNQGLTSYGLELRIAIH